MTQQPEERQRGYFITQPVKQSQHLGAKKEGPLEEAGKPDKPNGQI